MKIEGNCCIDGYPDNSPPRQLTLTTSPHIMDLHSILQIKFNIRIINKKLALVT